MLSFSQQIIVNFCLTESDGDVFVMPFNDGSKIFRLKNEEAEIMKMLDNGTELKNIIKCFTVDKNFDEDDFKVFLKTFLTQLEKLDILEQQNL